MTRGDWPNTETADLAWAARKLVLDMMGTMDELMDAKDPLGCLRMGEDRDGNPLERDDDSWSTLEVMYVWRGRLSRVNSALRELSSRVRQLEDELADLRGEASDG